MRATRASIESFLSPRKVAIAGVSRDPKKFGHVVFSHLKERGYEVYPVNPGADVIDGTPCFRSVSALPANIASLLVLTPKKLTNSVMTEALARGIDNIWIQQMSETPEAIELTKTNKVNLVTRECILMYTDPVGGIHKFHRFVNKLVGRFPK